MATNTIDDQFLLLTNHWQDWVTVLGYLGLTLFVVWRILMSSKS